MAELTVAVCVPTIPPRRALLDRALGSVWRQTRPPDQVVVTMDHEGLGAGPTRNRCWRSADTDYVAFLDDDDELLPEHLETCLQALDESGADVAYPWFHLVGWEEATPWRPDPLAVPVNGELRHPLGVSFGREQADHMRRHAFIPISTVVRRAALVDSGGFPTPGSPEWPRDNFEDWGCWLRLLDRGATFVHVPRRTWICYHSETEGTSGRPWRETPVGVGAL